MADKTIDDKLKEEKETEKPKVENKQTLEEVVNNGGTYKLANGATIYAKNHKKSNPLWYYFSQVPGIVEKLTSFDVKAATTPNYKSMLLTSKVVESEPSLQNLDIYSGYSSVKHELKKIWKDPYIKKTRSLPTRLVGTLITLINSPPQKLIRSGYYNPYSNTMVAFSPREAPQLDLVGSAHYFENKKYKLLPAIANITKVWPLEKIYSTRYANKHLPPHMRGQTGRFLFPMLGVAAAAIPGVGIPVYYGLAAGLGAGYLYNKVADAFKTGFPAFFDKYEDLRKQYEKKKEKKQKEKYAERMGGMEPEYAQ